MTIPEFLPIGSYATQGVTELPVELSYPTLKVEFEGNFGPSNWIPAGVIYKLASLGDAKPAIVGSRVVFLQQPNLITWSGFDLPYTLKFEPYPFLSATPLIMRLSGSDTAPPTSGGVGAIDPEQIRDIVGNMFTDSSSVAFNYDDATNRIILDVIFGAIAGTACEGTDSRLSDPREPLDGSVTDSSVANDAGIDWSKIDKTGSLPADVGAVGPGHVHSAAAISDLYEAVSAAISEIIQIGANMTKAYDPVGLTLTLDADSGGGGFLAWEDLILDSEAWEAAIS